LPQMQRAAAGNAGEREPKWRHLDERYDQTRMAEELNRPTGGHAEQPQMTDQWIVHECLDQQPLD